MSVGSDGKGSERYMVYIPFVLAPGRELCEIQGLVQFTFGKYKAKLEKLQNLYAISVGPFNNEEEAHDYIPHVTCHICIIMAISSLSARHKLSKATIQHKNIGYVTVKC